MSLKTIILASVLATSFVATATAGSIAEKRTVITDGRGDRVVKLQVVRTNNFGDKIVTSKVVKTDRFGDKVVNTRTVGYRNY